jgi:energy-coupling factor transporter ATP-binding protein EcfA2
MAVPPQPSARRPGAGGRPAGGPLRPAELAEAAILADLAVGLHVLSWLLPLGLLLQAVSVVPMAALAARHRPRAVAVATVASACVVFLGGGLHLSIQTVTTGILGLGLGRAMRRGWGPARTLALGVAGAGTFVTAVTLAVGWIFVSSRNLALASARQGWRGTSRILERLHLHQLVGWGNAVVSWSIAHWWASLPALEVLAVAGLTVVGRALALPALRRLDAVRSGRPPPVSCGRCGPPVVLEQVGFSYPGSSAPALSEVSLCVPERAFVAVTGPNGSGKSTLGRILAGAEPTDGRVRRGEGRSAVVFQRPESQVLGVRVKDDLVWGLGEPGALDTEGLLGSVGLGGLAERETSTLSGGQLQRLAVAAALARHPRLLVSDESTSMLDPSGRREVLGLLRDLVATRGVSVVHVTHRREEAEGADSVFCLVGGRLAQEDWAPDPKPTLPPPPRREPGGERLVVLEGVGLVYSPASPWAHRALSGVSLELGPGEGLLVTGDNGSGKSSLAWVLAGLVEPTEGRALFAGRPAHQCVGEVGVAFQHARLQLFRPTVAEDVAFGAELGPGELERAMAEVGLDPAMGARPIDELSGGEQRRVALAGLVARRPRLVVLDEPLAGLDQAGRQDLAGVLERLRRLHGVATVVVSHDEDLADRMADRRLVLSGGRVVEDQPCRA